MAEKIQVKTPRRGQALNAAVATLAALSVAFFIFAMPAEIYRAVAGAVGIGSRAVALAGAAALTFALIFVLLRALDRLPSRARREAAEVPAEPPRLRRADAHPDAPARVPVFARHELGEPLPIEQPAPEAFEPAAASPVEAFNDETAEEDVLELEQPLTGLLAKTLEVSEGEPVEREPAIEAPEQPLPSFIAHDPAEEPAVEPASVEEQPALVEAEKQSAIDDQAAAVAEAIGDEAQVEAIPTEPSSGADEPPAVATVDAVHEDAPIQIEEQPAPIEQEWTPAGETIPDEPPVDEPLAIAKPNFVPEDRPALAAVEPVPDAEAIEPMPAIADEPEPAIAYKPAPPPAPIVEPIEQLAARLPELPQPREEKISDLMGRLETGLGRRDRARWLGHSDDDSAEMPADDRLKSAIGRLRRMAGRG
jgi:hypothetical protein